MVDVKYEISKEDFEKAKEANAYILVPDSVKYGYGCYGAQVSEEDGKYYLSYRRGNSCD